MAKVIGPLHSTEARGRVDALVYGTWRGIRFVRAYVAPEFGDPDPREAQKARVAVAVTAWQTLTDAARLDWHYFAQIHTDIDWTGLPIRLTGFNWYVRCSTRLQRISITPPNLPPGTPPPLPLSHLAVQEVYSNAELSWTYPTQPTTHDYKVQIKRQGPYSSGRQPDWHHAVIIAHVPIADRQYDDPLTLPGRYAYWARVLDCAEGRVTPLLLATLDFTPPPPTGGITGRLMEEGTPVPGISVVINGDIVASNPSGIFTKLGLTAGNYTVTPDVTQGPWTPTHKDTTVTPPGTTNIGDFTRPGP